MSESAELVTYRLEAAAPGGDALAAYLTLNDPARRNALSDTLLDQLSASLRRAAADSRVRVVVLTSSHPRIFSSGGAEDQCRDHEGKSADVDLRAAKSYRLFGEIGRASCRERVYCVV